MAPGVRAWYKKLSLLLQYTNDLRWVVFPLCQIVRDRRHGLRCQCELRRPQYRNRRPVPRPPCPGVGKHPRAKWTTLLEPVDPRTIQTWHEIDPRAGWAVHLGPSNLVVLDVDPRNGGWEGLAALEAKYGPVPRRFWATTGGGGGHLYFRAPAAPFAKTKIDLAPGVELLSGRHIVVLPPSPHKSGMHYRWQVEEVDLPLDEPPPWMVALAHELGGKPRAARAGAGNGGANGSGADGGTTHPDQYPGVRSTVYALPASADRRQLVEQARRYVATLPPGVQGQNGSRPTFRAACVCVLGFGLTVDESMPVMQEYSGRCEPPWSDDELRHKLEDADRKAGARGYLLGWPAAWEAEIEGLPRVKMTLGAVQHSGGCDGNGGVPSVPGAAGDVSGMRVYDPGSVAASAAAAAAAAADTLEDLERGPADFQQEKAAEAAALEKAAASAPAPRRWYCPNFYQVMQRSVDGRRVRVICPACKKWDCPGCSPVLKDKWKRSITVRFLDEKSPIHQLWLISDPAADWPRLYKRIQRQRARHLRICQPDGRMVVFTTATLPGAAPVDKLTALRTVRAVIDALPLTTKPIFTCRAWKLIDEEKRTGEWKNMGPVERRACDLAQVKKIWASQGLVPAPKKPAAGSWIRHIVQASLGRVWTADMIEELYQWTARGEIPDGKIGEPAADDAAGEGGRPPPGLYQRLAAGFAVRFH
jgi:hypothetical protein